MGNNVARMDERLKQARQLGLTLYEGGDELHALRERLMASPVVARVLTPEELAVLRASGRRKLSAYSLSLVVLTCIRVMARLLDAAELAEPTGHSGEPEEFTGEEPE